MSAYDEGFFAFDDGWPISSNPYNKNLNPDKYEDWRDGYDEANCSYEEVYEEEEEEDEYDWENDHRLD